MDLMDLKLTELKIDKTTFGKIFTFIDFGNVNYWYEEDRRNWQGKDLPADAKLIIDIEKLGTFTDAFSAKKRFYYGFHTGKKGKGSLHIGIKAEECGFTKITKPVQYIKHHLSSEELKEIADVSKLAEDLEGKYIKVPKGNFDVEITVDAVRLIEDYDTFCLFSGDSDFANLGKYLRRKGKKVIIIAAGKVYHTLKENSDLYINAQQVKAQITSIKQQGKILKNLAG